MSQEHENEQTSELDAAARKKDDENKQKFERSVNELKRLGGFYYISAREASEPYDDTIYNPTKVLSTSLAEIPPSAEKILAMKGFKRYEEGKDNLVINPERHNSIETFIRECKKIDRDVNEVVISGEMEYIIGKLLLNSPRGYPFDDKAYEISYSAVREENDKDGNLTVVTQTLVGSMITVPWMVKCMEDDPNRIVKLFSGVFPKLEKKYKIVKNGRILFLENRCFDEYIENPDFGERFAKDYKVVKAEGE
ncbi:hypothetical protein KY342_05095 [Candidatus Woesearchaeota archaeon]|nr:hypothetical protein [Candidatus Woesearchaeota archaeon]